MLANKDNSRSSGFFTDVGQRGGGPDENTEAKGSVHYSVNLEGDLSPFYKSYAPVSRKLHDQCGGKKTRKAKHNKKRRKLTRKHKKHRKKTRIHKRRSHRKKSKRHTKRRRRQRGGTANNKDELTSKMLSESFRTNVSSGTNQASYTPNMNSGRGGIFSSIGGYLPTNECFDNYNHYEARKQIKH